MYSLPLSCHLSEKAVGVFSTKFCFYQFVKHTKNAELHRYPPNEQRIKEKKKHCRFANLVSVEISIEHKESALFFVFLASTLGGCLCQANARGLSLKNI